MKNPLKFSGRGLPQFTPLALLLLAYSSQCSAFGLGELHSHSELGSRLSAQVELLAPPEHGTPLAVRLASRDDYQKNGLSYPDSVKFYFVVSNEAGSAPFINISSAQAVNEPFLQLLLDVSYPGGRVVKTFTLLLDPPTAPVALAVTAPAALASPTPNLVPRVEAVKIIPVKNSLDALPVRPRARTPRVAPAPSATPAAVPKPHISLQQLDEAHAGANAPNLTLAMSRELSIGLHISKQEVGTANADALQEELIAKNKTLHELTLQITAMQALINTLKNTAPAASATLASSVLASALPVAASGVDSNLVAGLSPVIAPVSAPVQIKPIALQAPPVVEHWGRSTKFLLSLAGVLALLGGLYAWRYRREQGTDFSHSIFDDLHLAQAHVKHLDTLNPFVAKAVTTERRIADTVQIGDVSMKVPAYKAPAPSNNPEYDLLEQADIYLQFGHDKLAEEVLQEALIINPQNEQIYLTLLDIYDTRNDAAKFAAVASELEGIADPKIWDRVCKMGKRIDPDNDLYGLHLTRAALDEHNTHGRHIDNEFGELHITRSVEH
ncbi:MAG: hypothetical protein PXX73_08850 [Sideroxydans sp.]|nr:hypothetical protein [Sideroxydans sp.]